MLVSGAIINVLCCFSVLKGEHLKRGSRQEDFRITIGDGECVVTELTEDRVDCKPPSIKPKKKDDDIDCDGETMTLEASVTVILYVVFYQRYSFSLQFGLIK